MKIFYRFVQRFVLKSAFFLCLLFTYHKAYPNIAILHPTSDSLLKKAEAVYDKMPANGIAIAKQVFKIAKVNNNHVDEIKSLNLLAKFQLRLRFYDSAKIYSNYGLLAAEKYHLDSLKGDSWRILGLIDHSLGNYRQAIVKYNKSILFYTKQNKLSVALTYLNMGICERQISNYDEGIRYCLMASNIFESLNDDEDLANSYKSVAVCFTSQRDFPKAIDYNKKALSIRRKLKNNVSIAQSLNNIGFLFKEYHQPDSAISYLHESIILYTKEADSSLLILPLQNLGSSWKMKGDLKKAESNISRSLILASIYKMEEEEARGNLDLAEIYTVQNKYNKALAAIDISQKTAQKLKLPELLVDVYTAKLSVYARKGDYKNALLYITKKNSLKDSLFTIAKNKVIEELEIKYQTSQKEKDIAALNLQNGLQRKIVIQQKLSIIVLTIAALLLLLLFAIAYNNFRIKNKANLRIQTIMQELHHRVKNNLQILAGIFSLQLGLQTDENTKNTLRENEARLTAMNLIHSKLYMDNTTTQIEMQEYLTKLLHHIKVSFGDDNINIHIDVDYHKLEADKAVAIGLIINELATNAFKYAFDDNNGEIYLTLKQCGKSKILLRLRDNGKGITDVHKNKASFGLKLVNLLARQLNSELITSNTNGAFYEMEIIV